ncbi:hypothetical protein NQ317_009389 [Molorchus minor]|uniref:Uncharacterized protein n=1 Tax=Molorchus minor TaxID=1323400 RepID=A0ABQ9JQ65_9CUCU|nr:hypothetical protein NQ317_009389 [Molorchus minor]
MKNLLLYLFLGFFFLRESLFDAYRVSNMTTCPTLVLKNGKVKRRQRGRFVKFICNSGYLLAGERYSTCINGSWDPLPPKCVRPTCMNKVRPPVNGLIYPSHSGAALHFFCKPGYDLRGPTDIYCDGLKWDNNPPICLTSNTKPRLFCDFDVDICDWTHDLNHDFDWTRQQFKTPSGSIGTGPTFDHTQGFGGNGYYMYIESTSRNENDTARLISPIYKNTQYDTCFEFFYHMYGITTGTLKVYLKLISEDWDLKSSKVIFSRSGNQGDMWYRSYHSLGTIGDEYQIIIEGIRGPGYVSDIAIDDVKVIENCVFEDDLSTTTEIYTTEVLLTVESCEKKMRTERFWQRNSSNSLQLRLSTVDDYTTADDMTNEIPVEFPSEIQHTTPPVVTITQAHKATTKGTQRDNSSTLSSIKPPTTPEIIRKMITTIKPLDDMYTSKPNKETDTTEIQQVPTNQENNILSSNTTNDIAQFPKQRNETAGDDELPEPKDNDDSTGISKEYSEENRINGGIGLREEE